MSQRLLPLLIVLIGATITFAQPSGPPIGECFLAIGTQSASVPVGSDPQDVLLLNPSLVIPVTVTGVPYFTIPSDPALQGMHVYFQVAMFNPTLFPSDPIQFTNGLDVQVGGGIASYGPGAPNLILGAFISGSLLVLDLTMI